MARDYSDFPDVEHPYFLYIPGTAGMQFYATEAGRDTAWTALTTTLPWETMPTLHGIPCMGTCTDFLMRPTRAEVLPMDNAV